MQPSQDMPTPRTDKPLRFGTSGLRDFDANLTDREVYINAKGFVRYLMDLGRQSQPGGIRAGDVIALAADFRPSSRVDKIPRAVAAAILDSGCKVVFCGQIPTPAVMNYGLRHGLASIMVTGSHIPFGLNGIKFNRPDGEILKAEEKLILERVAQVREGGRHAGKASRFTREGAFKSTHALAGAQAVLMERVDKALAKVEPAAAQEYAERYVKAFGPEALRGLELVFYRQSTVGRDILPAILRGLGATVIEVKEKNVQAGEFLPVDTEKMTDDIREELRAIAREHRAGHRHKPFAVLSADGDSDRPVLCDEDGEFIPGDVLGVWVSMYLKPTFVAVPITCNSAAVLLLKRFARVTQTRVGSPYVNQAMLEALAADPQVKAAGYEANGGYLTGSEWSIDNQVLPALPTRDAALPLICALLLVRQGTVEDAKGVQTPVRKVSDLLKIFPRHTCSSVVDQAHDGVPYESVETGLRLIRHLSPSDVGILEVDYAKGRVIWRFDVAGVQRQAALTEPVLAPLAKELATLKERLSSCFSAPRGFAAITRVNYLDGLRIYFENGDIVHMRPSGNAPEFRFYAEADKLKRAQEISHRRVEIVRQMIRDATGGSSGATARRS
jgi:phosphomannomutase